MGTVVFCLCISGKKKKKESKKLDAEEVEALIDPKTGEKAIRAAAVDLLNGKTYEQAFDLEMKRMAEGKTRSVAWGSTYR